MQDSRHGFTLPELLAVIVIIGLVSAIALPVVLSAMGSRGIREAARTLQGEITGARDRAIHLGQPAGFRLLPDPAFPLIPQPDKINGQPNPNAGQLWPTQTLVYNRIVPLEMAPSYMEGMVTIRPAGWAYAPSLTYPSGIATLKDNAGNPLPLPSLILESAPFATNGLPNSPTSWMWNVRIGDKIQINQAGPWYTIIGPMWTYNAELFVNMGTQSPAGQIDYLVLVDGRDDNGDGWTDEGWDGVDNNGDGNIDESMEWMPHSIVTYQYSSIPPVGWTATTTNYGPEQEQWGGTLATTGITSAPYTIRRHPAPTIAAREVALPTSVVIDATTAFLDRERSRLPVNRYTGYIDVIINPDGTVLPLTIYGVPSSMSMDSAVLYFWLEDRGDVTEMMLAKDSAGRTIQPPTPVSLATGAYLPIAKDGGMPGPWLQGRRALVTLSTRTGFTKTEEDMSFLDMSGSYNINNPFLAARP